MEKIAFLALKGSKKAYWHTIPWDILVRILPTFTEPSYTHVLERT